MIKLIQQRKYISGAVLVAALVGLGVGQMVLEDRAEAQRGNVQAPMFEVDPLWPKPLQRLCSVWRSACGSTTRTILDHPPQLGDAA